MTKLKTGLYSKTFIDHKTNAIEKLKRLEGWVENIVGKRENASFQHFLLFPQCFQKVSFLGLSKPVTVW